MSTLYLDHQYLSLKLEGETLVTWLQDQRQRPIPLALLKRVVCLSNVQLETNLLGALAERGIAFMVANPRKPKRRALLLGQGHNDASLRLLHYRLAQDAAWRLQCSRELLGAKFKAQLRTLSEMQAQRPEQRHTFWKAEQQIQQYLSSLAEAAGLENLLGLEGAAARAGFMALAAVLPDSLGFTGRKRRPPPDPVNASLSLAFTLLHYRAVQVLHTQGLEPLLGFYHEVSFGRESLASDLIEVWRPTIEAWVWTQFSQQRLRAQHFKTDANGCFLDKAGRAIFFAEIEACLRPLTRALRWQTRALIRQMRAWEEVAE
ncbi:CRISPR-associated endonuclease Cas1 [uncultured Thiothrix sp.]|uniref:CRISPR-associated endonuclease Cas1 n=1 Tax=uncultured Thiothrix sp. TaxID=223185 RepID=UPI0026331598|nr:CRISPR-associated endonuclease Cas1 [uncultured Thiothrix sp.]